MRQGQARTKGLSRVAMVGGFGEQVADVLSQVPLLAHHHGIDVVDEIQREWLVWRDVSPRPTDVLPHEA